MAVETQLDQDKKILTIRIGGRFDFAVHQDFRKATDQAEGVSTIIVDLRNTEYVDSSALGMLLVLRDKVGERQDAVQLINAKPEVNKILQIANFDKLFTVI